MSYADRKNGKLTGRWVGEIDTRRSDGTEIRFRKRFATKAEADGYEAYVKATGGEPNAPLAAPTLTFAMAARRYREKTNPKWSNNPTNRGRLDFAETHLGKLDVGAIRKAQLLDYVETIKARCGWAGKTVANRTVNLYLSVVNKVLKDCRDRDELAQGLPTLPRLEDIGEEREAVPLHIENAVVAWLAVNAGVTYAFLVRVLSSTGMRRDELFKLRADQIEIPEQDENCGWMLQKEQTKKRRKRWVPLAPDACRKLKALKVANALPNAPQLAHQFKRGVKAVGGNPKLCIHGLRHATTTRLIESGANPIDVAELIGHKLASAQQGYYHPNKAYLFGVAKKVHTVEGEMPKSAEVVRLETPIKRALSAS